jgi:hypothetical protein
VSLKGPEFFLRIQPNQEKLWVIAISTHSSSVLLYRMDGEEAPVPDAPDFPAPEDPAEAPDLGAPEDPPVEGGVEAGGVQPSRDSRKLDCIICYCAFNLTERLPRKLYCSHTFCQACLRRLDTILNEQVGLTDCHDTGPTIDPASV